MVKVWLTEIQAALLLKALDRLKINAMQSGQWDEFVEEIDRLHDEIFHAGEDDE